MNQHRDRFRLRTPLEIPVPAVPPVVKQSIAVAAILWLVGVLVSLGLMGAVIYAVAHFVAKWWR